MNQSGFTIAEQVAHTVSEFQHRRTGHSPKSVTVVLSEGTVVITLHETLTPAEMDLALTVEGAAQVREYHRELFAGSFDPLRAEIERITGVPVKGAAVEVDTSTGAIIHIFTTGNVVQVFQLAGGLSAESWAGSDEPDHSDV